MRKSYGHHNTELRTQRHIIGQDKKTKKISNTEPNKNPGWTQVLAKGKQFLLLKRHPPCYSWSNPVKVLAMTLLWLFCVLIEINSDLCLTCTFSKFTQVYKIAVKLHSISLCTFNSAFVVIKMLKSYRSWPWIITAFKLQF